jgi:predicted nucleic acid-binding protein
MQYGWLDTSIFIHALFDRDPHAARCRQILRSIEHADGEGWLDAVTLHELTYVLPRARPERFRSRTDVVHYLLPILTLEHVHADDKRSMISALSLWAEEGTAFGDARLRALCVSRGMPVCTVNERDFGGLQNTYRGRRKSK